MAVKKDAFIYLAFSVINQAIPFLLLPILTRYLSPEAYGLMEMFMLASSFVGILVGLGAHGAVSRAYFDILPRKTELARFTGTTFLILIGASIFVTVAMTLLHKPIEALSHLSLGWLLVIPLFVLSKYITLTNLSLWRMEKKSLAYGLYLVPQSMIEIGLSVFLVVALSLGWKGRLIGMVATALGFSLLSQWLLQKRGYLIWSWDWSHAKEMLRFCVPLVPHSLSGWVRGSLDLLIIGKLVGLGEMGIYAAAVTIGKGILILVESFAKAWTPHVYEVLSSGNDERKGLVRESYKYMTVLGLVGIAYLILAQYGLPLVLGSNFRQAVKFLPFLVTAFVLDGWHRLFLVYIFYSKRTEAISLVTMASSVIHIILLFGLVNYYGIMGAAIAIACSSLMNFVLFAWISNKVYPMPWNLRWTSIESMR